MNVQNIQPKIYFNNKYQTSKNLNSKNSPIFVDDSTVKSHIVLAQDLSVFNSQVKSPSFGGWFDKTEVPYDEKPYKRKLFSQDLIYEKGKIYVNTSNPMVVKQILKEKYFSYDKDYKYEILTEENKKPLTNAQVEMLNNILNNRNCINLFNIKDFDYVLKHKDKGFVAACFANEISPTQVQDSYIGIFKKLNEATDDRGNKKYSRLALSDIENVTEENFEFFDKVYNYSVYGRFGGSHKERQALLQNIENANLLIDFLTESNVILESDLSCKIVQSEHFDKWMNILNEIQNAWEIDSKKSGQTRFFITYFDLFEQAVESKKYNPIIIDKVLKEAQNRDISVHKNVLLDKNIAKEILKKLNCGDEDDAIFMMWTGHMLTQEIKLELTKLREKRELTRVDYAVFEYAMNNNIKSSVLDVIENKPNLASVIAHYQEIRRVFGEVSSKTQEANKSLFNKKNDYTEDETNVIHKLLNKYPDNISSITFDRLKKIGYLNDNLFGLNYDVSNIMSIILNLKIEDETIKKVLNLNIKGFALNQKYFKSYMSFEEISNRLDLLKEISEILPNYMDKLNTDSKTVAESCEFLKEAIKIGLCDNLIKKGLECGCGVDEIEKLKYIHRKAPQVFDFYNIKNKEELDLFVSYIDENAFERYGRAVLDFAISRKYLAENLPDINELYSLSDISTREIEQLLKFGRRNRHDLKKLSLMELNKFFGLFFDSQLYETRLGREIKEDGGIKGIISSIIEEKVSGKNVVKPINTKAQGDLFNRLSIDKLHKSFEKFDANDFQNQKPFNLKYSRDKFISDMQNICKNYSQKDIDKVFEFLGFSLTLENDFACSNYDIPSDFSVEQRQMTMTLNKQIDKFIYENKVLLPENPQMEKLLNSIIDFFPEFISIIGKKQHKTHNYTIDVHTLKVLQECVNNPEYEKLSAKDRMILNIAVLLHDLGKKEGVDDEGHYELSAIFAKTIFKKLKINDEMKERIYNLVENHHWLGNLQKGYVTPDEVASVFRSPNDYKLAKIFAQADLKGVSDKFYIMCSSALTGENVKNAEKILEKIHSTNPVLFTSKILPKANIKRIDGVKVIDIVNGCDNLSEIFGNDIKNKEDLRFLVHMFQEANIENFINLKALCELGNNANLSASFVAYQNNPTYGGFKYGVVLDAPHFNVLLISNRNSSTGCKKDSYDMVAMLNPYGNSDARKKSIELLKYELGASDKEYAQIYKQLSECKKKSQIKDIKVGKKIFKKEDILESIKIFENSFLNKSRHNEVVAYNPKIRGLIAMINKHEDIPSEMKDFAKKHDLPIILLGDNTKY